MDDRVDLRGPHQPGQDRVALVGPHELGPLELHHRFLGVDAHDHLDRRVAFEGLGHPTSPER